MDVVDVFARPLLSLIAAGAVISIGIGFVGELLNETLDSSDIGGGTDA
jgi:hypothetical protein